MVLDLDFGVDDAVTWGARFSLDALAATPAASRAGRTRTGRHRANFIRAEKRAVVS